ncbi:MAG: CAP domain-containing protein [Myxococcales bacterium]|nr:CAP domain-containing protein [Myxococcales bacterium]
MTPGECSGHGRLYTWSDATVCACNPGYSPSTSAGRDCVPTNLVCRGGPIDFDVDGDGTNETTFEPSALECEMFELVNYTRATHDNEGTPECHTPLMYNVEWSAHARNHSKQMSDRGTLFHADYPSGQNCAYGCDPACEMDMYMNGSGEDHCPPLSHHCNIMRCSFSQIGIGYWDPDRGTFNTQNFL